MHRLVVAFLFLTAPVLMAQQQPVPGQDPEKKYASLEGKLTDATSGEPVRKGSLTLMPVQQGQGMTAGPPQTLAATSDNEGKFSFTRLEPGTYMMYGEKTGYVRQQYGARQGAMGPGTVLTLKAGEAVTGLTFALPRQAVITGRVLDEDGEPVQAFVNVYRQVPLGRQPQSMMGNMTNDVGEYRIANLTPGKYYLRAQRNLGFGPQPAGPTEGEEKNKPRMDYVSTFYPGAVDLSGASPVVVTAGQQASGIDIPLKKGRVYRVSGKVTGMPAGTRVQISLQPQVSLRGSGVVMNSFGSSSSPAADGSFVMRSVVPGSYELLVVNYDNNRPAVVGRTTVTVSNANLEDVVVQAGSTVDVTGRVVPDPAAATDDPASRRIGGQVTMLPLERLPAFVMPVRVQDDGTFRLTGVSRGKVVVNVIGLPADQYVQAVMAGSTDVTESGLDLTTAESVPPLEVRLSASGATVEGNAVDKDGKPLPGSMMVLLPQPYDPDQPTMPLRRKIAIADNAGHFSFKALAPGDYKLYGGDQFVAIQDLDGEQLKPFEKNSVTLRLKEKARETVEVKVAAVATPQ